MAELRELTCPNCGAKLEQVGDAAQAQCPHCGTQLLIERKAIAVAPAETGGCPECRKADRVQKVSSVYKDGFQTGYYDGWGHSQTKLSESLSPPSQPLESKAWWGTFETVGMGANWAMALVILLVGLMGVLFTPADILCVPMAALGLGLTLLLVLVHLYSRPRQMSERLAKAQKWERAMNRWERLYYCARDDGVFIPGETPFIPMNKVQEFLYAD